MNASAKDDPSLSSPEDEAAGLIFGRVLDGAGGGRRISWAQAQGWAPAAANEVLWLHIDRTAPDLPSWLATVLKASETTCEVLLSNETRPRAFREHDAVVTVLRGVNLNAGAEPVDMIAMQIWADADRVITFRRRRLQTPRDVLAEIDAGSGPKTAGDLLTRLVELLVAKMSQTIVTLNGRIDAMETTARKADPETLVSEIAEVRRDCLGLKRYMSPQHEALSEVQAAAPAWMSAENLRDVRETVDRLRRYLDDLDVSKESALVLQDDLNTRSANRMNEKMYMLAIVAAIVLPLSVVTGLLGINVGGMPGVNSAAAFWITVGLLVVLLSVQFWIFRRLKWI